MNGSITQLLVWLLLGSSISFGGHYYLYRRLVVDPGLTGIKKKLAAGLLALLACAQLFTSLMDRRLTSEESRSFFYFSYTWLGLFSTLIFVLLLVDIVRVVKSLLYRVQGSRQARKEEDLQNPKRRLLFKQVTAGGAIAAGLGSTASGVATILGGFEVRTVNIPLTRLPKEFEGYRIVQVSDIHIGPTIHREFIQTMVDTVNSLKPDMIAVTGDLVDGAPELLKLHTAPLAQFESQDGTFFVTGNHEYYSGAERWLSEVRRLGMRTLENERVLLKRGDASIDLAGVNDYRASRYGARSDLQTALKGRNPDDELILLAHQPAHVHEAIKAGVGLQISGHTHGGQFWPWNLLVYLAQPVVRGLARFGETLIYVSTGTGYWGPPVRNGSKPEITVLTLRQKKDVTKAAA